MALAQLRLWAEADLALGRERLLAGDADAARAAFARARRWHALRPGQPAPVPGEPLVLAALDAGRLEAAASAARVMRQAGDPLGPLYAAVAALEGGDEAGAREAAAASRIPLASRGLGRRLARALAARDAGARTLLLDRNGELAAAVDASGTVHVADGAASLLPGVLERLQPVASVPAARLAVDFELSRAALTALGERRGSIVLVDARTGALRAAVSDARTAASDGAAAFSQRREPASIAKILTAAAAYRAGVDADAAIAGTTCTGVVRYGGRPLWCTFPGGRLAGLDDALGQSCNVAFANLGTRLGARLMLDEYRRWGFGDAPSARLASSGRVHTRPRTPRQLADIAVGLELVDVTPLHAALLAAVVANDGRMPEPWLIIGACGPLGLTGAKDEAPASRDVLAPAFARRLRQAMEAVARSGTGVGLAPPGFAVAMKTGTAAERGQGYHVNYVGFGPLPGAELAFCVRLTHEPTSPAVTTAARDVTRALLLALADRWRASRRVQAAN